MAQEQDGKGVPVEEETSEAPEQVSAEEGKRGVGVMGYLEKAALGLGIATVLVLAFLFFVSGHDALQVCDSEDAVVVVAAAFGAAVVVAGAAVAVVAVIAAVATTTTTTTTTTVVATTTIIIAAAAVVIIAVAAAIIIAAAAATTADIGSITVGIYLFVILAIFGATVGLFIRALDKKKISNDYAISIIALVVCFIAGILCFQKSVLDYRSYLNMARAEEMLVELNINGEKCKVPASTRDGKWLVSHLYYKKSAEAVGEEQKTAERLPLDYVITTNIVVVKSATGEIERTNRTLSWKKRNLPLHLFSYDKDEVVPVP